MARATGDLFVEEKWNATEEVLMNGMMKLKKIIPSVMHSVTMEINRP